MEKEDRNTKEYELAVLVRKEEDLPGIAALVREHEGELTADFKPKRVALAYPIKKEKEAIFAYARFRSIGETAKALEKDLNVRQDVLRSLVVILPKPLSTKDAPREIPSAKRVSAPATESRREPSFAPLSNEALEKKIEEILK